jgi:RNA polymerase sigma-70 factor (ECF subfamily)
VASSGSDPGAQSSDALGIGAGIAAVGGAEWAKLVEPHRAALRLRCYRMLGSSHDSDDTVQETFVRALRSFHTLAEPGALRGWLYRIATNVCLDELARRPGRRARGPEPGPPSDPEQPPAAPTPDEEWLEPFPSSWLGPLAGAALDPMAQYTLKESVALAFVAALQVLTPPQRGALAARRGWAVRRTDCAGARVLGLGCKQHAAPRAGWSPELATPVDRELLERYLRAWQSGDLQAIIALLHAEATLSMPPVPTWISGGSAVARFFTKRVTQALASHLFRVVPLEVCGSLGVGFYRVHDDGQARFFALHVLETRAGRISVIDHFMSKSSHAALFADGLAATIPA